MSQPRRPAPSAHRRSTANRWRFAASALAVATLAATIVSPPSAVAGTQPLRVGSYNIRAGVSTGTFQNAVRAMTGISDVAGLQEVNSHAKEDVLASLRDNGWSYYRPNQGFGEQNPVIWDSGRFSLSSDRSVRLAPRRYIGNELHNGNHYSPAIYAAVVRLRDSVAGGSLTIINVHLVPGAVINGRPTSGRPRLFKAYRESVVNLGSLTRSESSSTTTTYVLGDFNVGWVADRRVHLTNLPYATFLRQSKRSMWATERPSGGRGSHVGSPSLIDQVYTAQRAAGASVQFSVKYSDHFPVVASYQVATG